MQKRFAKRALFPGSTLLVTMIGAVLISGTTLYGGTLSVSVQSHDEARQGRAEQGKKLFEAIQKKYPGIQDAILLIDYGLLTNNHRVALFLPRQEWRRLSVTQKLDLIAWVEQQAITNGLSTGCWAIGIGDVIRRGSDITMDKLVVQGDTAWNKDDPCCRGTKASEFKKAYARE